MNILQKNLDALKINQIDVYEKLMDTHFNKESISYEIYKNLNNELVLKYKNDEGNFVHYTSYYNPYKQAKNMIKHINFKINRNFIVVIGIGLGYQIDELLLNLKEKHKILVIERDKNLLKEVLSLKDFSKPIQEEKLFFAVGNIKDDNLLQQISTVIKFYAFDIFNMQEVSFPVFDNNYVKFKSHVLNYINKFRELYLFALGNDIDDTLIGIKNMFDNIPRYIISPGLNDLKREFGKVYKNKPAIIIASGPSLNKNIEKLKKAKGKALLLSCDGSVTALQKKGIIPDAVGSVERIYKTYEAFYKDNIFNQEIVLVAPAVVRKEIPDTFNNRILATFKSDLYAEWFNNAILDKGAVWSGASVSHFLFGVAHELGCNPIILVGQDLAYSEEGISHVENCEVKEKVNLEDIQVYVRGKNGKMLPSTHVWEYFKLIYEEALRVIDIKVIDSTEGGALIEGTEILPLEEALDLYCNSSIPSLRDCIESIKVEEQYIMKAYENIIKQSYREIKKMNILKIRIDVGLQKNIEAQRIINQGINNQFDLDYIYDTIFYVENKIVKKILNYPTLKGLFQYLIFRAAYEISMLPDTEYNFNNLKYNLQVHKKMLDEMKKYINEAINIFENATKNIKESYNKWRIR